MNETQNPSYSLLNQKEIDILVKFLSDKKNFLNSDVLNQTSIDKLIKLITGDSTRIIMDMFDPFANVDTSILKTLEFRANEDELCELRCSIDSDTDYIILTAYNTVNNKELVITPKHINDSDTNDWGYSISPTFFNRLARVFSLKYTTETHDMICNTFSQHNYGSPDHKIPEVYLPSNDNLIECLL